MSNYGFRISQNGYDVKTCTDLKTVITSKYSNLKGTLSGTVNISKTADYQTKALITHNLGYFPIAQVYFQESSGVWIQLPYLYAVCHYTTTSTVYIKFFSGVDNGTYSFKYFINLDKSKL